ncbi:MAG: DEAD/DEAH box helicase [Cyclobacteriaceae bacterium]|nr:DEAD/DEAH box helicase [Cyclobacteriaceae bacterium]
MTRGKRFIWVRSGLLNAPTGSGKTYALWVAAVMDSVFKNPQKSIKSTGPKILWITPLRALAKDIRQALQHFTDGLNLDWRIELRTGDTSVTQRKQQLSNAPECLVTTPESLHILFSLKDHEQFFKNTESIIVDEWHELLGTKRGVQTELAIAHIAAVSNKELKVWGISATIGNLNEALQVLIPWKKDEEKVVVRANTVKKTEIETILPDSIERFPWSGHLGLNLLPKILPIIQRSNTTLLFTNTRSQTEMWYKEILNKMPELAGVMAMHHGSIDHHIRIWVEDALAAGKLKLVVCTSSLDLGVDFSPVDTIVQIGGPKGISRFLQRAGRSGHRPGVTSRIYFVPTHSLELIEGSALKTAEKLGIHEDRQPIIGPLDVLVQYLVTLAAGSGFDPGKTRNELMSTNAYKDLQNNEWQWALDFITSGGKSLSNYTEYSKVHF